MKLFWLPLVLAGFALSQTPAALSFSGPTVAKPATTVTITLTLTGGNGPAGVQWDMAGLPAGAVVATSVTGKTANCTATRCLVVASVPVTAANGVTPIPDGAIATITYPQPATVAALTVPAASTLGATPAGAAEVITAPAGITVPIQSNCDINGDGLVNATDIGLILQQALAATTGTPTVLDVLRVIIAANGGACLR
jgi:hypothetical protein